VDVTAYVRERQSATAAADSKSWLFGPESGSVGSGFGAPLLYLPQQVPLAVEDAFPELVRSGRLAIGH
jgi:hypothetical protein